MNENHAQLCWGPEWAEWLRESILEPLCARVDLGNDMLEIGPGAGAATDVLRRHVAHLTVLELDGSAASGLVQRFRRANVEVVTGDAMSMQFADASFDSCAAFTMLHHIPTTAQQDAVLFEVFRVLRPGGVFVGSDSLASDGLHAFHVEDTYNPVEPSSFFTRLRMAGFGRVLLDADDHLEFLAVKPGGAAGADPDAE